MSVMPPCNQRIVAGCAAEDEPRAAVVLNWSPGWRLWPTWAGLSAPSVLRTSRPSPVLTTTASATGSRGARGRSLGPTRRTDMGYPLVRSTDGARCSTWFAGVLVRAALSPPPGPTQPIVPSAAARARAGPLVLGRAGEKVEGLG